MKWPACGEPTTRFADRRAESLTAIFLHVETFRASFYLKKWDGVLLSSSEFPGELAIEDYR